jgi:hypothetical protein
MQAPSHDEVPSRVTRPWMAALRGWHLSIATTSVPAATSADNDGTVRCPSREALERSRIEVLPAEMRPTVLRTNPYPKRTNRCQPLRAASRAF